MAFLHNPVQRCVDALPFGQQLLEHLRALGRKAVEALVAAALLAPLAGQQPLGLEPPQQRIERAFVDLEAQLGQRLAKGVAVVLGREAAPARPASGSRAAARGADCRAQRHQPNRCVTYTVYQTLCVTQ